MTWLTFSTTINDNEIKLDKAQVMFDNLNGNLVLVEGEEVIGFVMKIMKILITKLSEMFGIALHFRKRSNIIGI